MFAAENIVPEANMKKVANEIISCSSCGCFCEINAKNEQELDRCPIQKIVIWPARNKFLRAGVLSMIIGKYESLFCRGCIFVDFTLHYLRYFTNSAWIEYIKTTNLSIVLISDKAMAPLAAYWKKEDPSISYIIDTEETTTEIIKKLNSFHFRLTDKGKKIINPLNETEVKFLELLTKGLSLRAISEAMSLETKKIYRIKDAVEKKTGINIRQFLMN